MRTLISIETARGWRYSTILPTDESDKVLHCASFGSTNNLNHAVVNWGNGDVGEVWDVVEWTYREDPRTPAQIEWDAISADAKQTQEMAVP